MHLSVESVGIFFATAAPVAFAATGDAKTALDLLPVSAGISGAIVAALRGGAQPSTGGRWGGVGTVFCGAAAAVFAAPVLSGLLGFEAGRAYIFAHFLTGVLGTAICDEILANRAKVAELLARLVGPTSPTPTPSEPKS